MTSISQSFLEFLQKSPSPYHAVNQCQHILSQSGFQQLNEKRSWDDILNPGGRYYFNRNGSTIVAFTLGRKYQPGQGFYMIGAHTDSPCMRIKPNPDRTREGYGIVGVSTYGGGIWHTWFDRDLGIAGKIVTRDNATCMLSELLVNIDIPILKIPSLAIHLDRSVNEELKFNKETQFVPVLCLENHEKSTKLSDIILQSTGASFDSDIIATDLCLYDLQPPTLGGANQEFIFSARLDNLFMSYCALQALIQSESFDEGIKLIALFDNEEVGSQSAQGADSNLLESTIKRLLLGKMELYEVAIQHSFLVSADVAHAVHPNYSERHEDLHKPKINQGIVIKTNCDQRYATTCISSALFKQCCDKISNVQEFVIRNDMRCGSTIGPILASQIGIRVVDVGLPILSMHSIREMGGIRDLAHGIASLRAFFDKFYSIDKITNIL